MGSGFILGPEGAMPRAHVERLRKIRHVRQLLRRSGVDRDGVKRPGYAAARFAKSTNARDSYGEGYRDRGRQGDARHSAAREAPEVPVSQRRDSHEAQEKGGEDDELWRPVTETERRVAASRSRSLERMASRPAGGRARRPTSPVTLKKSWQSPFLSTTASNV